MFQNIQVSNKCCLWIVYSLKNPEKVSQIPQKIAAVLSETSFKNIYKKSYWHQTLTIVYTLYMFISSVEHKEDILGKKRLNEGSIFFHTTEVNEDHQLFGYPYSSKLTSTEKETHTGLE